MGKRDDKFSRAAHIKRHTKGTSNELSFSVLDAAKNALDGERDDDLGERPFGRISLFTLPGRRKKPSGTPTKEKGLPLSTGDFVSVEGEAGPSRAKAPSTTRLALPASPTRAALPAPASAKPPRSPEEEIARRKARRRLSKVAALAVVVVVTGALLVAGGSYLYHDYQVQQGNISLLDESLALIKQADETALKRLDATLADPFAEGATDERAQVRAALEEAEAQLASADEKARAASSQLRESKDKEAANQAVATVAARQAMLREAEPLLDAAEAARQAADRVTGAWDDVLKADALARDAAVLVAETTEDNVKASKDKTNEALAVFDQVLAVLDDVQNAYPEASLAPLASYVGKRIESLGYAIASDDALLAKDKETAAARNEAYNKADAEAAALAKAIPADPSAAVLDAYEAEFAETSKAYSTARLQAGSADAFILDYLGSESK